MKYTPLFLILLLSSFFPGKAQGVLQILNLSNQNVGNTTVQAWCDTSAYLNISFKIKNTGANNLMIKVRKQELSIAPGSTNSMELGNTMFISSVYTTPCKLDSGTRSTLFVVDYYAPKNPGSSTIRYTVYDCGNLADSVSVTVVINATPAGISEQSSFAFLSESHPNPGSCRVQFDYAGLTPGHDITLNLFNAEGILVLFPHLNLDHSGTFSLDVSSLPTGLYFLRLDDPALLHTVRKIQVIH